MIALFLDALATYRLTKLVTHDTLTVEARESVIAGAYRRAGRERWGREQLTDAADSHAPTWAEDVVPNDPDPPKLATLVTCPYCAGMWVAFGVVLLRRFIPRAWAPLAEALALSATTGVLSEKVIS